MHIELLGLLMAHSLIKILPKDELGDIKHNEISDAFFVSLASEMLYSSIFTETFGTLSGIETLV